MILNAKNVVGFGAEPVANRSQPVAAAVMARQAEPIDRLLHWVYGRQLADKARGGALDAPAGVGMDSCLRLVKRAELGTHVDGGGQQSLRIHPDAAAVDEAVMALFDRETRGLVLHYARLGIAPDWLPGAKPQWRAVRNARGRVKKIYHGRRKEPVGCLVEVESSLEKIAYARRTYAQWWAAIARLAWELEQSGRLVHYAAGYPRVLPAPWKA